MRKSMMRNYTREHYIALAGKMRQAVPGVTLSTDIIVGFPGETEEDFRQTLSLVEELQFDWGFVFKYSAREGTPAAELECLPQQLIEERHQRCLELVDRIALKKRLDLVGTIQDVLIEELGVGRTRTNYKVHVRREAQARQGAASINEAQARAERKPARSASPIGRSLKRRAQPQEKAAASSNIINGDQVRVRITNAQRATLEGEVYNGNLAFENFREEDCRAGTCPDRQ